MTKEVLLVWTPWVLQVETPRGAKWLSPCPQPSQLRSGQGPGLGQAGSGRGVQMATWRARGPGLACLGPDRPPLPTPLGGRAIGPRRAPGDLRQVAHTRPA